MRKSLLLFSVGIFLFSGTAYAAANSSYWWKQGYNPFERKSLATAPVTGSITQYDGTQFNNLTFASALNTALAATVPTASATNAITARSGGGQGSAVALTTTMNRVTTVAADHDSVKLPTSAPGLEVYVANDGANILDVYPITGDVIGSLAANVAVSIPSGREAIFTSSVAGTWNEKRPAFPNAKYSTNTTTTTFTAGQLTGATDVTYASTVATPGSIATRTATQMFGDDATARVGGTYNLRVTNAGTSAMTITAGSGVTLTGTMTIAAGTFRNFIVTYTTATALVIQEVNATNGIVTDAGTQTLSNKALTSPVINGPAPVACGSTCTLAAANVGTYTRLDTAGGSVATLPGATGSGTVYRLYISVATTSASDKVLTNPTTDTIIGTAIGENAGTAKVFVGNAGTYHSLQMPFAGSQPSGGFIGDTMVCTDVANTIWKCDIYYQAGTTPTTPYSASTS